MRITSVRVRKLMSGPGYNHHAVEAEAVIEEGEDPSTVRDQLSAWVDGELRGHREMDVLHEQRDQLRSEVVHLERQRDSLHRDIEGGRKIIAGHAKLAQLAAKEGIDADLDALIPF